MSLEEKWEYVKARVKKKKAPKGFDRQGAVAQFARYGRFC